MQMTAGIVRSTLHGRTFISSLKVNVNVSKNYPSEQDQSVMYITDYRVFTLLFRFRIE